MDAMELGLDDELFETDYGLDGVDPFARPPEETRQERSELMRRFFDERPALSPQHSSRGRGGRAGQKRARRARDSPLPQPREDIAVSETIVGQGTPVMPPPEDFALDQERDRLMEKYKAIVADLERIRVRGQRRCFFCNVSSHKFDRGEHGTTLIAYMIDRIMADLPYKHIDAIIEEAYTYYKTTIEPVLKRLPRDVQEHIKRTLPPFDREEAKIHFRTAQHTLNPYLLYINHLRDLDVIKNSLACRIFTPGQRHDSRTLKEWREISKELMLWLKEDPHTFTFATDPHIDLSPEMRARVMTLEQMVAPKYGQETADGAADAGDPAHLPPPDEEMRMTDDESPRGSNRQPAAVESPYTDFDPLQLSI